MEKSFDQEKPKVPTSRDWEKEMDPKIREKMKKNLVYFSIFSIIMLFMAFSSAYIVSMGDSFWVKYQLPVAFWVSTALIGLSSLTFILAIASAKKDKLDLVTKKHSTQFSKTKIYMILTVIFGFGFAVYQFKGYGQLVEKGAYFRSKLIVTDGRYGDYYEIKYKGTFLGVNGNTYTRNGQSISESEQAELIAFANACMKATNMKPLNIKNYGSNFQLIYKNNPLTLVNGKLMLPDGKPLEKVDLMRLQDLSVHMRDKRIDFFLDGECGKDFQLYFKGREMQYKNRTLMFNNKPLDFAMQSKLDSSADSSTSYLYIITFLHLLHVICALLYLIGLTVKTFVGRFHSENTLSLRLGSIFWHFLGFLWLYLLLFLLFIH